MINGLCFLAVAVLMDVLANILLKKSAGFRKKTWGMAAVLSILCSFFMLAQAVKTMDLSVAYALWGAVGLLLTTSIDMIFYHIKLKNSAILGLLFMITGILLIHSVA
jgi:Membrane transporters of cations and cationic drugs